MKLINKFKALALAGLMVLTTVNVSGTVHAVGTHETSLMSVQSNYEPTLKVYQSGSGVKAEWAVDLLPQDILYTTSFEIGDDLPNLMYGSVDKGGGRTGGQSFSSESAFSGERSLKVHDTYSNGQIAGNPINGVTPFSNMSRARFLDEKKYIDNGIDLSMTFKVRTEGNSGTITPLAGGVNADYGITMAETFAEDVNIGDTTVKVSDISVFKSTIDSGRLYYLADRSGKYARIQAHSYNEANSTITVNRGFQEAFRKGDNMIRHRAVNPLTFPGRTVNSSEWVTVNMNTKVPAYPYFDIKKNGFNLHLHNSTRGTMYIDDLQMGYATQTELYRGGTRVYQGKLSDYEDTAAKDKAAPGKVEDYDVKETAGKQSIVISEPKDHGSSYEYQVKAISNDGSGEYWSEPQVVDVVTGIKGYSYVIDTNANTNPNGTINNTTGVIEIDNSIYKDHYLHIQAIDEEGNKSLVNHIKLDKVNDITNPSLNLTHSPTKWTNDSVIIHADATDNQSGIKSLKYIGENMIADGNFQKGNEYWDAGGSGGTVRVENGSAFLDDNTVTQNKLRQTDAFIGSEVGARYYAEVKARGIGVINARYAYSGAGKADLSYMQDLISDEDFHVYTFPIVRDEYSNNSFHIERVGLDGWIEIADVKVYAQRDLDDDSMLEVTRNGTFTFIAEDNSGNVTSKSHTITNIDKEAPNINVTQDTLDKTHENINLSIETSDSLSGVKRVFYESEGLIKDITGQKNVEVTGNGTYKFTVEDNAGNMTNETHHVSNIERTLSLEKSAIENNVILEIAPDMKSQIDMGTLTITDWRDSNTGWRLLLGASPLSGNGHTLPGGSISFKGVDSIEKMDGNRDGELISTSNKVTIDDGYVEIIKAEGDRGVYQVNFKDNALELSPPYDLVKKGVYNTKLTWVLESTVEVE